MDAIDRIRAFNRAHTRRIGLLDQGYLDKGLSLPEVRVLFELAHGPGWTARALAEALGLTEGYLSRLIARLVAAGLVRRRPNAGDHRAFDLALTDAGSEKAAALQALSRSQVAGWFEGRAPGTDAQVAEALETAEAALTPPDPDRVAFRDLAIGDAGWLIERHGTLYARDEGFDESFEALVAGILADFIQTRDPARERAWIAWDGPRRLGSVFCVEGRAPDIAKLRLFLLDPAARGMGLGQRLLELCLGFARDTGYRRLELWTHESHRAACALYAKNGFELTDSRPAHSFGVDVIEQEWGKDLGP
ncbi:GNAT family N-acetyltransferase [Rhodobacterales bacterium HKCCE2091]|nr:GNAT family N-acetyltransferase [Rhodobacterales bacterium HKCCE2091]